MHVAVDQAGDDPAPSKLYSSGGGPCCCNDVCVTAGGDKASIPD